MLSSTPPTLQLLGYPADARLLILNADDFGMCTSINTAVIAVLAAGAVRSTSVMMTCPQAPAAVEFLCTHPGTPCGVHLTAICDAGTGRWGPLSPPDQVPDLVGSDGSFVDWDEFPKSQSPQVLIQIELEFRAQIEAALAAGLKPAHLDWHYLRMQGMPRLFDLLLGLSREYGLALRVIGRSAIDKVRTLGLPGCDHDLLDSFTLGGYGKAERYIELLHSLPAGLSEWAVHPGLDEPDLLALEPDGDHVRQADHDFWTSPQAGEHILREGIILIDYRQLQEAWKGKARRK